MKKNKFKFTLVVVILGILAVSASVVIGLSINTFQKEQAKVLKPKTWTSNQQNYQPPINSDFNQNNSDPVNPKLEKQIKAEYQNQTTADSRVINNITIYKPILSGPQNLLIKQNEQFDPRNYNFLVYDQFGAHNATKIQFSQIDTTQTGVKTLTAKFISKFNFVVTKQFKVDVVDATKYGKINGETENYQYDAYVNNSNLENQKNVGGDFGLTSSWQLTIPTPIYYGDQVTIKQTNAEYFQKYTDNFDFMIPVGQNYKKDAKSYSGPHAHPAYFSVSPDPEKTQNITLNNTSNALSGALLLRTKNHEGSQIMPEFQIQIVRGTQTEANTNNPITRIRKLPYYLHKYTDVTKFANYWNSMQNFSGVIIQNDVALFTPSVIDLKQWLAFNNDNKTLNTSKTKNNFENKAARNELVVRTYQYLHGFDESLQDKNNLGFNINLAIVTDYAANLTGGAWVNGRVVTRNWNGTNGSLSSFINSDIFYVHEIGHIFQANNITNGTNYVETTNMLFGQYIYWSDAQKKWLASNSTFSKEAYEKARNDWFNQSVKGATGSQTDWNRSTQAMLEGSQFNKNFYKSIDLYDYSRRFIFLNIFATAGWETFREFNILWRKVANGSLIIPNLTTKDAAENFFYVAIGLSTNYDASSYLARMGLPIKPELIAYGAFSGWRTLSMISDIDPLNQEAIIKQFHAINNASLVDNSAYSNQDTGQLDLEIQGLNLTDLPAGDFQVLDNQNNQFHVLTTFKVTSLSTKVSLPIGAYFIVAPKSKSNTSAPIIPVNVKIAYANKSVITYNQTNSQLNDMDVNAIMNNLRVMFRGTRFSPVNVWLEANEKGLEINYFHPPLNQAEAPILFHPSYPKDNVYFSYNLTDANGHLIDRDQFQNNGYSKTKFILGKDNKPTTNPQPLAQKSTSSFGDNNYSPIDHLINLDFRQNQKYRLEIFHQHLISLKFANSTLNIPYGDQQTIFNGIPLSKYQNQHTSIYGDRPNSNSFDTAKWTTEQKKAHTLVFTVSQAGLTLGWNGKTNSHNGFYDADTKTTTGFNAAQKQLMQTVVENKILSDVQNNLRFLATFNSVLVKNPNNFSVIKDFLSGFKNSDLKTKFENNKQLSQVEIHQLNDFLTPNQLRIFAENPGQTVLKNGILITNFFQVFANNQYYNAQNQLAIPKWSDVIETDFPTGLATVNPGTYYIKFAINQQNQKLEWTAQIQVVS